MFVQSLTVFPSRYKITSLVKSWREPPNIKCSWCWTVTGDMKGDVFVISNKQRPGESTWVFRVLSFFFFFVFLSFWAQASKWCWPPPPRPSQAPKSTCLLWEMFFFGGAWHWRISTGVFQWADWVRILNWNLVTLSDNMNWGLFNMAYVHWVKWVHG